MSVQGEERAPKKKRGTLTSDVQGQIKMADRVFNFLRPFLQAPLLMNRGREDPKMNSGGGSRGREEGEGTKAGGR